MPIFVHLFVLELVIDSLDVNILVTGGTDVINTPSHKELGSLTK